MVEAFKTINTKNGNQETIYAVTCKSMTRAEVLKQVAAYKKESLERVKKKFKKFESGCFIQRGEKIELYAGAFFKGGTACVIVRR